ncbi:MAG: glucose-6-phosphate dehydrogenase assembly protein OpcA [Planctomycetes bacterium]|nr:glucose-6-phosphate dehydrogenase assembly protein OpcA [Planctomycetota bacterium]
MDRGAEKFTAGEPLPVGIDVASIEADLRALWDDASQSGVVARFVQLTLIALLDREDLVPATTAVLAEVARSHPARVILIVAARGADPPLSAWVSAHCHLAESETRHICSEQITITAGPSAIADVPDLVDQLILPDLPVVLWSRAPAGAACALLDPLARRARQIIVDSGAAERSGAEFAAVAKLARAHGDRAPLADLAWLRGSAWREVTAQLFDGPCARPLLDGIEGVRIRVASDPDSQQVVYHISWLASRLGWEPAGARRAEGGTAIEFAGGERRIRCRIEPSAAPVAGSGEGDIASVEFSVRAEGRALVLRAALAPDGGSIEFSAEPAHAALPARGIEWERVPLARLIHGEIEFPRRDALFEEVLPAAEAVAAAIGAAAPGPGRVNRSMGDGSMGDRSMGGGDPRG